MVLRGVVGSIGAILDGNLIGSVLTAGLSLFIGAPMVSGAWIRLRRQGLLEASLGQHRSLS